MIPRPLCHSVRPFACLAIVAVLVFLCAPGCDGPGPSHPAVGRVMGPLPVVSLAAEPLPAPQLVGKITLLNFWGTWCPPCRRELPVLVRLADRLASEPAFQFIPVSCGSGDFDELATDTRDYLARNDLAIGAWAFPDPVAASVFTAAYGLRAFPTTYLIGPDARIERVWVGYRPRDEADMAAALVESLKRLAQQPQPAAR
jgi:cytochrome c biogenesis protein CcmG/thiol:disulfide interchange protein DsbE